MIGVGHLKPPSLGVDREELAAVVRAEDDAVVVGDGALDLAGGLGLPEKSRPSSG